VRSISTVSSNDDTDRILSSRWSQEYLTAKLSQIWIALSCPPMPDAPLGLPGHLHPAEGRFLHWLATQVSKSGIIVEIGSYLGRSSSFIACGLREHAKLVCVDTWRNENFPDIKGHDCMQDFLNNMKSHRGRFEVARGKSEEVARQWNKPIDSIFIDGDHS